MQMMTRFAPIWLALALAACGGKDAGDPLVNVASAKDGRGLGREIVVDPARVSPARPRRSRAPGMLRPECEKRYSYEAGWAGRLPAALPVYPKAKVNEAAGTDLPGCRMRIVSFTSAAPAETILYHYQQNAVRAGYTADRKVEAGDMILAGTRGEEAYYIIVTPAADGGSAVDLVANHGA